MSTRLLVAIIFFVSGAAGLIYEVVWAKHLALVFGSTAQAQAIVLATFMGGLAAGYNFFGKIADKSERPLYLYAWMEIAIGCLGALSIIVLEWMGTFYFWLSGYFGLGSLAAAALKLTLSCALIFLPTFFMGGTLPVLSRFSIRSLSDIEVEVGWLYFLNSLGAAAGSLVAGFVLIPSVGLNLAITTAAALNIGVGLIALALQPREKIRPMEEGAKSDEDKAPGTLYSRAQVLAAVTGVGLSGVAALIYEVAWIRLLALVIGSSTYAFSLMLAAFITGIALGGLAVARKWIVRLDSYLAFAYAELGVALSIILTLPFYERLPYYFAVIAGFFARTPETFWLHQAVQLFICFSLMLLPTFFLGMTLPLASQISARSFAGMGQSIGEVFSANTAGTILGGAIAGLVLLPYLGMKGLIELGVIVNIVVGTFILILGTNIAWTQKTIVLGVSYALFFSYLYIFPSWDKNILSRGVYRTSGITSSISYEQFRNMRREEVLYYKDGANSTVTISRQKSGNISLQVNGKTDASSHGDLPTQILSAQIPLLLKPDASHVLVIGLGSGITAGSALTYPVTKVEMVEISPEVVEASRFFSPYNHDALKDRRLKLHIEDGKTFLKLTPELYDIVISEPSNPWIAGIGNLFSLEFYEAVRARLRPDGIMVQWFHTYEMTDETLRLLLRTFAASFEHVTLWSPKAGDLILVGSRASRSLSLSMSAARLNDPKIRADLARLGISTLTTLLSLQISGDKTVREAAGKGSVNQDIFPILEYEAPKAFFLGRPSGLLTAYDERLRPPLASSLYLAAFMEERQLSVGEIREMALYHLGYGSLTASGLSRPLLAAWLERSPNDLEPRWIHARMQQQAGDLEGAFKEIHYLLNADPTRPEYLETAANLEFQMYLNRRTVVDHAAPDRALGYFKRLLDVQKNQRSVIYQKIAEVHAASGDYQTALHYLGEAASHAAENGDRLRAEALWLEVTRTATAINDRKSALHAVNAALALNPQNGAARQKLQELTAATSPETEAGSRKTAPPTLSERLP